MSSSSPSSSSTPSRTRKRSAKAMETDNATADGWMPKIRIINFDPSRKPGEKSIKTAVAATTITNPDPIAQEASSTPEYSRQEDPQCTDEDLPNSPHPVPPPIGPTPEEPASPLPIAQPNPGSFAPQVLMFNGSPVFPSDPLYPLLTCAKFCENCHTSETSYWRTDDNGKDHCNPCGLHWTKHHSSRPIDPNSEPNTGKLANLACQICPTRKHARRREEYRGVILCNACTDYWKRNNAVRPLIAFAKRPKGDRAREPGMIRQTKKCANCGTGRSSRWMIGPNGEDNCSECGLFWMYHKMSRPLGVGVGVDVIGPKRETRGPRIMDSRKRRLGSAHTGSGSDTENDQDDDKLDLDKPDARKDSPSQIDVETPEPPDDTPISLVNFAILARKIQLHFQELSLLNSPLINRPAISSLQSVIDPVLAELSPLSRKSLSEFTRSAISKGVQQLLLAHVVAAEAESSTSEEERLNVVTEDDFGPDEIGDNFYSAAGTEAIVAAKGLVDLHNDDAFSISQHIEAKLYPGFLECHRKISTLCESEDRRSNKQIHDGALRPIRVGLFSVESNPTITIDGNISPNTQATITDIAKEYKYPVIFTMDSLHFSALPPDAPSISVYNDKSEIIVQILQSNSINSFHVNLYLTNHGPAVIVGANISQSVKQVISAAFKDTPVKVLFSCSIQPCDSLLSSTVYRPALGRPHEQLQPGSSLSRDNEKFVAGTFGCVLMAGTERFGLTTGYRQYVESEYQEIRRSGLALRESPCRLCHPAEADVLIESAFLKKTIDHLKQQSYPDKDQEIKEYDELEQKTRSSRVGAGLFSVLGYGTRSLEDESSPRCKLDYALFTLSRMATNILVHNGRATGNIASLSANMRVLKVGRSTGLTFGIVSGIKAKVQVPGFPYPTAEWTVIGDYDRPFARKGDIGSSVWDEEGNLLGLIWECCPMEGSAFVTPISEILDSLKRITGVRYMVERPDEKFINKLEANDRVYVDIPEDNLRLHLE